MVVFGVYLNLKSITNTMTIWNCIFIKILNPFCKYKLYGGKFMCVLTVCQDQIFKSPFPNCHFKETHSYTMKYIVKCATYLSTNKFSPHLLASVEGICHFFVCSEGNAIVSYCENYEKCKCLYFQMIIHSLFLCIRAMCDKHTDKPRNPSELFHLMIIDSFSQICLTYRACRKLSPPLSMRYDLIRVSSY